jgi:hypothetical protein
MKKIGAPSQHATWPITRNQMSDEARMTNNKAHTVGHSRFVIPSCFVIGASSF